VKVLVFTDLDGTLLNQDDYSFQDALPAIELLKSHAVPLLLVSSKTADEMFVLRKELGNVYPFVCENGGLVVIPDNTIAHMSEGPYEIVEGHRCYRRGESRSNILTILGEYRHAYRFSGLADMSVQDIAAYTGLDSVSAELANKRAASEPVVWRDTGAKLTEFSERLARHNLKIVRGGRFHHVMGECDKGDIVRLLIELYRRHYGEPVYSIALGDSPNDLDMLKSVNVPVVIPHPDGKCLSDPTLNDPVVAPYPGARGWNDAVSRIMKRMD
jgi:mannosyl-3-phosphoglycerate phosphatase